MPERTKAYEFRIAGKAPDELTVRAVSGVEAMSALYSFAVRTHSSADDPAETVGARAALVLRENERERRFTGMVASVRDEGFARGGSLHTFRLVPRAWRLRLRRNSRIFQHLRVDQIVSKVLSEAGLAFRWHLTREYPVRTFCTQYEETDWAFVQRLAAEHGIFFFFEQGDANLDTWLGPLGDAAELGAAAAERGIAQLEHLATPAGPIGGLAASAARSALAHIDGGEALVFCDDAALYPNLDEATSEIGALGAGVGALADASGIGAVRDVAAGLDQAARRPPTLRYHPEGGALGGDALDSIREIHVASRAVTKKVTYEVFDPERPRTPIRGEASCADESTRDLVSQLGRGQLERASSTAAEMGRGAMEGAMDFFRSRVRPFEEEAFEHHGTFLFPHARIEPREADRILESERRHARVGAGQSENLRLEVGRRFALEDHPLEHMNGDYVVTAVRHSVRTRHDRTNGATSLGYRNGFRVVPATRPYVPARPRRRNVQACLTATVVAHEDAELLTQSMAMVKVQFHWDRDGERDEHSSCFIRCMQSWAGAGWGTQFLPRAGSEVVIGFEGGDPDKPLVLGSVYNAINPAPFPLPEHQTRSGLRTRSTPDGEGSSRGNELSFEDARGREEIKIVAERDMNTLVRQDRSTRVTRHDETRIDGEHTLDIHGHSRIDCHGGNAIHARRDVGVRCDESLEVHVGGRHSEETRGARDATVRGDLTTRVRGCATTIVGAHDAPRSHTILVEGVAEWHTSQRMHLSSDTEIVFTCGNSSIRMTPDEILVCSPSVVTQGEGAVVRLRDKKLQAYADERAQLVAAEILVVSSNGASMTLGSEATLDGARVLLNSPGEAEDAIEDETPSPTVIELRDDSGEPLAYQQYRIECEDGAVLSGMLDRDGRASVALPGAARITFAGVSGVEGT